jgi:membrane protein involved in colicin uptake
MKDSGNLLLEGMERLGLIAARIRQNQGPIPQIEIDIILQELRNLYMEALKLEAEEIKPAAADPDRMAAEAKRQAEEEAARKAAEAQRKAAEEAARKAAEAKRQAEEEAARKAAEAKRQAEEEAARKAAEAKRQAEEEAARKAAEAKRQAEEEARKAAEAKRQAEEEAARKAAEAKRQAEEEARKAAEAKRKAEEEAFRKAAAEELKPIFAPEPVEQEAAPVIEPMMEKIEGNPNDELFADEPAAPAKPAKQTKAKSQESSLFDYFKNSSEEDQPRVRTLADTLNKNSRNVEEQLETRVNAKKVDDLRTIININDKFSFMSELFHNNMKAYNDFILRLNSYTSREEALAYVAEVAAQYMWHENSMVVKSFYKVFDRKF